jgi:hypothetical protein
MDGAFYGLDSMEQLYLERNQVRYISFFELGIVPYRTIPHTLKKLEVIPTYVTVPPVKLPEWRVFI